MQIDTDVFVVWANRSAASVFGSASNPVRLNGALLCFRTESKAQAERDRLNSRSSSSHVRYSVRSLHVQLELPDGAAKEQSAEPRQTPAFADISHAAAPRAA